MSADLPAIGVVVAAFFIAGGVKGVIGFGLPTVSLGLMTLVFDLRLAVVLLIAPSLATNFWQAAYGGRGRLLLSRLWLFFLMAAATVPLGALALSRVNVFFLSGFLGALLFVYAALNLTGARLTIPPQRERGLGVIYGALNGVFTGMTGSSVVPGVMYLQSLGLPRDALVQAMGILFVASAVTLALALSGSRLLTADTAAASLAAIIPAFAGLMVGARLRRRLSEKRFRRLFFIATLILGVIIMLKAAVLAIAAASGR